MTDLAQGHSRRGWRWSRAGTRLVVMFVVGSVVAVFTGVLGSWPVAPAAGWSAAAAVFVGWVWLSIARMDAGETAAHATREDPSRRATDALVLIASVASLAAVGVVLVSASSSRGIAEALLGGTAILSVALSWVLIHTLFTLKYARLYYGDTPGGIGFNQDERPRYTDFAYLAFTIGMCFQVSDTELQTHPIRATALRQGLLAYLFGAVILATIINLIAGLGG